MHLDCTILLNANKYYENIKKKWLGEIIVIKCCFHQSQKVTEIVTLTMI